MTEETQTKTASNSQSLLIGAKELAVLLSISERLLYKMHSSGRLGPLSHYLGRRILWIRKEIEEWVDSGLPPRVKWVAMRKMQSDKGLQH